MRPRYPNGLHPRGAMAVLSRLGGAAGDRTVAAMASAACTLAARLRDPGRNLAFMEDCRPLTCYKDAGAMPTYGGHRGTHLLLSRVYGGWRCRRLPSWKCR